MVPRLYDREHGPKALCCSQPSMAKGTIIAGHQRTPVVIRTHNSFLGNHPGLNAQRTS